MEVDENAIEFAHEMIDKSDKSDKICTTFYSPLQNQVALITEQTASGRNLWLLEFYLEQRS